MLKQRSIFRTSTVDHSCQNDVQGIPTHYLEF